MLRDMKAWQRGNVPRVGMNWRLRRQKLITRLASYARIDRSGASEWVAVGG